MPHPDGGDRSATDSSDDDDEPEHSTFLLLGRSSSGKTCLIRSILEEFKAYNKSTYLLNDRNKKKPAKWVRIDWNQLDQISSAQIVVEDVVQATPLQLKLLFQLLNVDVHHKKLSPCIVVSHCLMKNNLFSTLPFYTRIYWTGVVSNILSVRNVLNYFAFTETEKRFHLDNLINNTEKFAHFVFHVDERRIEKIKFPLQPLEEEEEGEEEDGDAIKKRPKKITMSVRDAKALSKAKRYFSILDNENAALALFELLWSRLPKQSVDLNSLEITLQKKKGNRPPVVVSLISYIALLVDDKGKMEATRDLIKFHQYVKEARGWNPPSPFLLNKSLR